jgi:2-phospho-L-lactate/phosphoenolpyruvate guanylyltransferase
MILVPVKNLANAKQRLASVLGAEERSALAAAMLEDVLETLSRWTKRPAVAIVTGDPWAKSLARKFSFEVVEDSINGGETAAITMATQVCEANGAESTWVLPADIPLVQIGELEQVVAAAPLQGTVLVPAHDGRGTNTALRRPAALFTLRFGDDSFHPHVTAACATGHPCVILRLPGIGLDVDRPADLAELLGSEGHTRAQALLHAWKVAERLMAVQTR